MLAMSRLLRIVAIGVEATANHCNNSCRFMEINTYLSGPRASCTLFQMPMVWDKRKKQHGYKRTDMCKLAEVPAT